MTTPTTTATAIRAKLRELVKGISPALFAGEPFRPYSEQVPFETWCFAHPTSVFRRFYVEPPGPMEPVESNNRILETDFSVRVAYSDHYGRYGQNNRTDLETILESDGEALRSAIGIPGYGSWPLGSCPVGSDDWHTEDRGEVTFLVLTVRGQFYFAS